MVFAGFIRHVASLAFMRFPLVDSEPCLTAWSSLCLHAVKCWGDNITWTKTPETYELTAESSYGYDMSSMFSAILKIPTMAAFSLLELLRVSKLNGLLRAHSQKLIQRIMWKTTLSNLSTVSSA